MSFAEETIDRSKIETLLVKLFQPSEGKRKSEKLESYRYFYDMCIGSPKFIETVHTKLVEILKKNSYSNEQLNKMALILQYPRRHFPDFNLKDPFPQYGLNPIENDNQSVTKKMKYVNEER